MLSATFTSRMVCAAPASRICIAAALLIGLLLTAASRPAAAADRPVVILISLDGTTLEQIQRPGLPALATLASRGVVARMRPVFPTNTFPNHVTLVTGVSPETHGIVSNTFRDPRRGIFDKDADPHWMESEPLWSIAEDDGIGSASYHWVGSEGPWRSGRGPRRWKAFDASTPESEKVDQILSWLALPDRVRPQLVTSWFHGADAAGHRFGPDAPEVARALAAQDRALARLIAFLDERRAWPTTTLIVVSDHGMAPLERRVDLDAALGEAGLDVEVIGAGGFATLWLEGNEASLAEAERVIEVAKGLGLEAYPASGSPEDLPTHHPRFGQVVVVAPVGTSIGKGVAPARYRGGGHGHRPDASGMAALFAAMGRGVAPGVSSGSVRALDVAPTVLGLLGVPVPASMEGRVLSDLVPGAAGGP